MKGLRNYINSVKPNFVGEGKYSKWFPLFDAIENFVFSTQTKTTNPCLLYTSPSPRDATLSRMPSSA